MKYRYEIDGLRAIAVMGVVLCHAGIQGFKGGFVGVDIFFVISGYLISTIITNDLKDGNFSFYRFYVKRVRRLAPALLFVILCCLPIASFTMLPDPLENFAQSIVATILFSNNILLYLTSGYWDLASEFKPLLHTWSLGVEEQFYILFPILLFIVWHFCWKKLFFIILIMTLLSFASGIYSNYTKLFDGFYLLPTRAWEILVGALVAIRIKKSGAQSNNAYTIIGFLAIVYCFVSFDENYAFPSLFTLIPVLGTVLILSFGGERTIIHKVLKLRPFVLLGLMSYSIYLWHQPILAFSKIWSRSKPMVEINIILIFIIILISWCTWQYVEKPFRNSNFIKENTFLSTMAFLMISLIVIGLHINNRKGDLSYWTQSSFDVGSTSILYNEKNYQYKKSEFQNLKYKVLVVGNSFGRDVVNMLVENYELDDISIIYRDDFSVNTLLQSQLGTSLFKTANLVIFASNYDIGKSEEIKSLIKASNEQGTQLYFFGTKHFGYNLNWLSRVKKKYRSLLRNPVDLNSVNEDKKAQQAIPSQYYVSLLKHLVNNDGVLVTDDNGYLLSGDRVHLTRHGASLLGDKVFLALPVHGDLNGIK